MPAFGTRVTPLIGEMFLETFDYEANVRGYIGHKLMPIHNVPKQAGQYYYMGPEHLLKKNPPVKRNPDGTFNEISQTWGKDSYSTEDEGVEARIDSWEKTLFESEIQYEAVLMMRLNGTLAQAHETEVIALVDAETPTAASAVWTTISTDIKGDVEAAITRLDNKLIPIDRMRLKLVVPRNVWLGMKKNVGILDTFGSSERTDSREATKERIADILEVGEILVANSKKNDVPEFGTPSYTKLWTGTKAALVVTGEDDPEGENVRWGNTCVWSGGPPRFDRYEDKKRASEFIRNRVPRALKKVCPGAIEVFSGVSV